MNDFLATFGDLWAMEERRLIAMARLTRSRAVDVGRFVEAARQRQASSAGATSAYYLVYDDGQPMVAAGNAQSKSQQATAVIPVVGPIENRPSYIGMECGWPSAMVLGATIEASVNHPEVKAVVLDIDSPGGVASGVPELASRMVKLRGQKPIIAVANTMAASAAYWIGSAADRLYVTPSGQVGSIGVFSVHYDESKAMEAEGVKATIIKAGKYKAEFNPFEPLTDEARDHEQGVVDSIYSDFVNAVAYQRKQPVGKVREEFGQGRTVSASKAAASGMVDGVATFEQVLSKIRTGKISMRTIENGMAIDFADEPVMQEHHVRPEPRRRRAMLNNREID